MEKWEAKTGNNDIRLSMLGLRRKLHQFQSSLFLLGKKAIGKGPFYFYEDYYSFPYSHKWKAEGNVLVNRENGRGVSVLSAECRKS